MSTSEGFLVTGRGSPIAVVHSLCVVFQYGTEVTAVDFNIAPGRKQATRIHCRRDGVEGGVGRDRWIERIHLETGSGEPKPSI